MESSLGHRSLRLLLHDNIKKSWLLILCERRPTHRRLSSHFELLTHFSELLDILRKSYRLHTLDLVFHLLCDQLGVIASEQLRQFFSVKVALVDMLADPLLKLRLIRFFVLLRY